MIPFDATRELLIGTTKENTLDLAEKHWVDTAQKAIQEHNLFAVALSGGSTPNALYARLAKRTDLPWKKILLFWGDERAVPHDHPESNYSMAMHAGLSAVALPENTFPMPIENDLTAAASTYESLIREKLPHLFDLVMLGVGEDGHTASLFPNTKALQETTRLVVANHVPQKNTWRITLTFPAIQQSQKSVFYALGKAKETILPDVLQRTSITPYPSSYIGTTKSKALWILDAEASSKLKY